MDEDIISKTIAFVKERLLNAEGGHDWFHTHRVLKNAQLIVKTENVDMIVVSLGALLHDIADSKFYNGDEGIGPKIAETLNNAGISTFADLAKTDAAKISEIIIKKLVLN